MKTALRVAKGEAAFGGSVGNRARRLRILNRRAQDLGRLGGVHQRRDGTRHVSKR